MQHTLHISAGLQALMQVHLIACSSHLSMLDTMQVDVILALYGAAA